MTEGVIVEWRKAVGDVVEAGETLVDITTDKVDVEVPAPSGGRIARIAAEPGDTVAVGALLAELVPVDDEEPAPNGRAAAPAAEPPAPAPPAEARAVPIVLPDMESVTEATVIEWRKAVGDAVAQDEIVVEVSTDKVDLEVPAPAAGTLARIDVRAGDTFPVSQPLGEIAAGAAPAGGAPADGAAAGPAAPAPTDRRTWRWAGTPPRWRAASPGSTVSTSSPCPAAGPADRSAAATSSPPSSPARRPRLPPPRPRPPPGRPSARSRSRALRPPSRATWTRA